MATRPKVKVLTNTSVDVLNVIRENGTQNYKDYVPVATKDAESIKTIGNIMMNYPAIQNEFLQALINRIGAVIVTSKMYSNPWNIFKKGMLDFGETIEEIFVDIAKPHQFDQDVAEEEVFKREIPDVRSAFHIMNYQKFYKRTVSNDQLRQAFLSWDGITDLIARIVDSMYTAANYDEFQSMKYMLAITILDGRMYPVSVPTVETDNLKAIASTIKGTSNMMEFASTNYNIAGVTTYTNKNDQYVILNAEYDAMNDVEVLASAFNMDKADFMGHRVLIDGFGKLDIARLNELFGNDPNYREIGEDEMTALNVIPAVLVDRDFFMIYDNFMNFTEIYNGEGLYWNYWLHAWKTFSISPFANNAAFIPGTPGVTSVTMSPKALVSAAGQSVQLSVNVVTTNFAPKTVTWEVTAGSATVNNSGLVTLGADASGTVTVKATSTFDNTKSDTCNITIQA